MRRLSTDRNMFFFLGFISPRLADEEKKAAQHTTVFTSKTKRETHMLLWLRLGPKPRLPGERPPPPDRLNRTAPTPTPPIIPAVAAHLPVRTFASRSSLRRRRRRAVQTPQPSFRGAATFPQAVTATAATGGSSSGAARPGGRLARGV